MRFSILIVLVIAAVPVSADETGLSLSVKGSLTSSTRFLYNIDRNIPEESNENVITNNFGFGAEARWNIFHDRFSIGISFEKIHSTQKGSYLRNTSNGLIGVPVEEGFEIELLELSGLYVVPLSTDNFSFYMGGGFGSYNGDRIYSIANVRSSTLNTTSTVGMHVFTGADCALWHHIAVRIELKFRDPHFDVTNKFEERTVKYNGSTITLNGQQEVTRVNLYGINYALAVVYSF